MRRIQREQLKAPAKVIDLELTRLEESGEAALSVEGYRTLWCLCRVAGTPVGISFWDVEGETDVMPHVIGDGHCSGDTSTVESSGYDRPACEITVVICTRDRPEELRRALLSLRNQSDRDFGVLVIDNAPSTESTAQVVEEIKLARCDYVIESKKGLSRARNTALAHVRTDHVAWIDDDEVADTDWVKSLKEGFAHPSEPVAVCGVMLPAELETEAQVRFEQYGGFNKGRGLFAEILSVDSPSASRPLYPLPAIGSGGNMAFQMEALRAAGGFDQFLGAGTRTHGGEETKVFATLLRSGGVVLHWPRAITWHFHRREMTSLHQQFYGYSAGLSAFYASMIRSDRSVVLEMCRLAPHALRDLGLRSGGLRADQLPADFPKSLLRAGRRGLLAGAFSYTHEALSSRIRNRSS